jgi:crossover junction endodeoxyribonuclease RuvC
MRVIGIDPGLSGGIAYYDDILKMNPYDMPTFKDRNRRRIDARRLYDILQYCISSTDQTICFLEKQNPHPKQGVVSVFTLGEQYGLIKGILTTLGIAYQEIPPHNWQKEFSITGKGGDTKQASYKIASSLYPTLTLKTERGRILDGRCDAVCITEYCRRKAG